MDGIAKLETASLYAKCRVERGEREASERASGPETGSGDSALAHQTPATLTRAILFHASWHACNCIVWTGYIQQQSYNR